MSTVLMILAMFVILEAGVLVNVVVETETHDGLNQACHGSVLRVEPGCLPSPHSSISTLKHGHGAIVPSLEPSWHLSQLHL